MKTSAVAILASVTAVLAKPVLLNAKYDIVAGEPFELKYSGCEDGCTITLENGPEGNLKRFQTLTADATGDSFTFTLDTDIPTDKYAIRIVDNSDKSQNFSPQFNVEGSGAPATSAPATSAPVSTPASTPSSTSAVETTSSEAETTSSEPSTSSTPTTVVTSTSAVTPTPQTTSSDPATTSSADERTSSTGAPVSTSTTKIPDSGATGVQAQLGLILAAAAAVAYL